MYVFVDMRRLPGRGRSAATGCAEKIEKGAAIFLRTQQAAPIET
jgi:hypothetical protein